MEDAKAEKKLKERESLFKADTDAETRRNGASDYNGGNEDEDMA